MGIKKDRDCSYGERGECVVRVLKRKVDSRKHWQLESYLKGMTCLGSLKICEELLMRMEEVEWEKFYSNFFLLFILSPSFMRPLNSGYS